MVLINLELMFSPSANYNHTYVHLFIMICII